MTMTTSVVLADDVNQQRAAVAGFLAGYCGATRRTCLRRHPRPGQAGPGARRHRPGAAPRRRLPDGRYRASSHLEDNVDHMLGTFLYTVSTMHCMTVSLSLDGDGLGTAWGEQKAQQLLAAAGFDSVEARHVDADILNTYYIARTA